MKLASIARRVVLFGGAPLLAVVLLYYSLRGVEWRQVAHVVSNANPGWLALSLVAATCTLFLRACRWRIILNAEGSVSVSTVFGATAAGYFGNNFLPARAGELVRIFLISARSGLDGRYVLATAVAERVLDALALVVVGAAVLMLVPAPPGWLASAQWPMAILAGVAALAAALLPRFGAGGRWLLQLVPLPSSWRAPLASTMDQALRGLFAFRDRRRMVGFVALTVVIWSLDVLGVFLGGRALGLPLPVSAAFLLIVGLGLGSALPATPGYVGIYQFVAVTVLTPYGLSRSDAIAFILFAQAQSYLVIGCWGGFGLWHYFRSGPLRRPVATGHGYGSRRT